MFAFVVSILFFFLYKNNCSFKIIKKSQSSS